MTQMLWPFGFGCHRGSGCHKWLPWDSCRISAISEGSEFKNSSLDSLKIPWFEVENWPRISRRIHFGFQEASLVSPSEVCNGRRIDLQADLSDLQGIGVPALTKKSRALTQNSIFETTYQHYQHPNHIFTSGHPFDIIWSYFRFRLGSTSGYDLIPLIQCDKPKKPSPSPCLWVLC